MADQLTNLSGNPVDDNDNSMTAGPDGPSLLQDRWLLEKMARFNRERVPERVVHAKGGGARGFFEVTDQVTDLCKADLFAEVGKRTPMLARFSTVAGEQGYPDTARDPRGFALKFYTQHGNWDLVGNNTPVFFVRDAVKFQDFIWSQKRVPETHLRDHGAMWDFWTRSPESLHQTLILMSDRGTPKGFRHMHGFGSHTFKWVNADGLPVWVKMHFLTDQGIANFTDEEAAQMGGTDPDYAIHDLYDAIARGEFPSWTMYVQVMAYDDAWGYRFNPFDVTKVWPHADYPLRRVGRFTLDTNPVSYFNEIEQAAFEPNNMPPGIEPSPDKMLQGRLFSYSDTHRYRIGTNYDQLAVNAPVVPVHTYHRDGSMSARAIDRSQMYAPNSFGGPEADPKWAWTTDAVAGRTGKVPVIGHAEDNDYVQPRMFWAMLDHTGRDHLVHNIVNHLQPVDLDLRDRVVSMLSQATPDLGDAVTKGLADSPFPDRAGTRSELAARGMSVL